MPRSGSSGRVLDRPYTSALLSLLLVLSFACATSAATLTGQVRDPDGRAVAGVRILLSGPRPDVTEALTNRDGRFEIAQLPPGRHEVRVVAAGFAADSSTIDLPNASSSTELSITLRISAVSESLTVSAAQVDLPLSQAASSIDIVTGEDIESRQLRTVGDALRTLPGLSVANNGALGGLTSLFTRGGESDFTLVLVDGMRANDFGGGIDLSQIPLVDVERVEVVRGPQSAVFGSDAMSGVVQIVTRGSDHERGELSLEGGGLGTTRGTLSGALAGHHLSASGYAELSRSDGYTGFAPATGERVSNDDGRIWHGSSSLGWYSGTGAEIRARALWSHTERGFPGAFGSNPIGAYERVDLVSRGENHRRQVDAQWAQPWTVLSGRIRQRTEFGLTDFDGDFVSPYGASTSETRRVSFRTQADVALTPVVGISTGLDLLRERAGSTFITASASETIPVKRLVGGYFAELRYFPTTRVSVSSGVRMDRIRRDALAANTDAFSPRPAFAEVTTVAVSPRVAVSYLLRGVGGTASTTRLHGSAGSGLRPPDAFEIAFTDNPDLKPERSRSGDIGVQQTFSSGLLVLDATAFYSSYDDLIVAVGTSFRDASRYQTDNISNARARGLELSAGFRPASSLQIRTSYTFLDTEILSIDRAEGQAPAPYRVGEALIRRPRHGGSLTLLYASDRWTSFAETVLRGAVRDVEPTLGAFGGVFNAKGYSVVNVGGTFRLGRLLQLFARVENAANRRYEEAFGFPSPGRVGIGGIRVAAGH